MKTLAITVAAYNLAETSRMIEIAKEAKKYFHIVFLTYGGRFEELIDQQGFKRIQLKPRLTSEKLKQLQKVLNGDTANTVNYFNKNEIEKRVQSEVAVFKELKPVAVMAGWNLTVGLSSKISNIEYVNVLHLTSITEYYEAGLQSIPDAIDIPIINKIIGKEKIQRTFNKRILTSNLTVRPYNHVRKRYGLKPFSCFVDLIEGEQVLLADVPQWVTHPKLRSNVHHIGPLPAHIDVPIPEEIIDMPKDKPIIYFAMGSSGKSSLIAEIIEGFENQPYYVIAPVASHINGLDVKIPPNVFVTGFLPADKVNAMADVAVIHGGQNTVMNACLSGTPIVGIGMHAEQQANLDACVRKGFAIRLSKKFVNAKMVLEAIEKILNDKEAKRKIQAFKEQLLLWNGPKNAAELLNKLYG